MYCISDCCLLHLELCTLVRCLQKIRINPQVLLFIIQLQGIKGWSGRMHGIDNYRHNIASKDVHV